MQNSSLKFVKEVFTFLMYVDQSKIFILLKRGTCGTYLKLSSWLYRGKDLHINKGKV